MTFKTHAYALPVGHILHNVYSIQGVLNWGSFGITYLASHIHLKSESVIKEYLPEGAMRQDKKVVAQHASQNEIFQRGLSNFYAEAQILHNLTHPNIVKVTDLFEDNGTAYFVMPYMGKNTLWDWMTSHSTPTVADLAAIFLPLLDGLQYIHERNLLHRDIKPTNIILTSDGTPMLIDFGSARFLLNSDKPMSKMYTPNFAPIEQLGNQSANTLTPALDIYSLSGCLYQIITGQLPHDAYARAQNDTQIKLAQQSGLHNLYPHQLLAAIDKGLSVHARDRFQSANEMKWALQSAIAIPQTPTQHARPAGTVQESASYYTPPPQAQSQSQSKPQPQPAKAKAVAQSVKPRSGSLKKWFKRGVFLAIVGGAWQGVPMVKQFVSSFQKPPVDKPYRDTVELTIGKQKATYTGWLKNGIAEDNTGTATIKFADGTTCTVGVSNNQRHGTGKCIYPKGSVYDGAWKNDLKHGYGKYTLANISPILSYEGGFVNGKFSGKGVLSYRNGAVFSGEFANDDIKLNGKGAITGMFGMASRCEGVFTRSKATCQFRQGKSVIQYSGSHKNGLWNGEGEVATIDNGTETSRYRATFRNGDLVGDTQPVAPKKPPKAESASSNKNEKVATQKDDDTSEAPLTPSRESRRKTVQEDIEQLF